MVTVHCMARVLLSPRHDGMMGLLQRRIERCAIYLVRQLLSESHDDFLRITSKDTMTCGLRGQELGEPVGDLLILGLLSRGGMNASR